jgi:putative flippase GtrA
MSFKAARGSLLRWLKFNTTRAIGVPLQLAVLGLLKSSLRVNYLLRTSLAVEAAVLGNFFWREAFTWADRRTGKRLSRLLAFNPAAGLVSIAGKLAAMRPLAGDAGMSYHPANLLSIAIGSLVNFRIAGRAVLV